LQKLFVFLYGKNNLTTSQQQTYSIGPFDYLSSCNVRRGTDEENNYRFNVKNISNDYGNKENGTTQVPQWIVYLLSLQLYELGCVTGPRKNPHFYVNCFTYDGCSSVKA